MFLRNKKLLICQSNHIALFQLLFCHRRDTLRIDIRSIGRILILDIQSIRTAEQPDMHTTDLCRGNTIIGRLIPAYGKRRLIHRNTERFQSAIRQWYQLHIWNSTILYRFFRQSHRNIHAVHSLLRLSAVSLYRRILLCFISLHLPAIFLHR